MSLRHHCHGTHINHQHFSTGGHSTYMVEFHQGGCPGGNPESHPGVNPRSERSTACNRCCSTVCFVTPVTTSVQDLGQDVTGLPTSRPGRAGAPGDPRSDSGSPRGMGHGRAAGIRIPCTARWLLGGRPVPECGPLARNRRHGRPPRQPMALDTRRNRWAEIHLWRHRFSAPGASIQLERACVRGMHRYRRCVTVHDADSCFEGGLLHPVFADIAAAEVSPH
jgi:hypothetical protein